MRPLDWMDVCWSLRNNGQQSEHTLMGHQTSHDHSSLTTLPTPSKLITDIYNNFVLSNQVILHSLPSKRSPPPPNKKREQLTQLLQPFARTQRYCWGAEIAGHFTRCFWMDFEVVWSANREQFYEALLLNCRVDIKDTDERGYQHYFYTRAITFLQDTMPQSSLEGLEEALPRGLGRHGRTVSVMEGAQEQEEGEEEVSTMQMLGCSLLMPQTIFTQRLSPDVRVEVSDLLRFYTQMGDSLNQVLHCNSLVSCPLKHFVASIQEQLQRKHISKSHSLLDEHLSTASDESRRIRRTRETNNNFLLSELRCFLEAYTEFTWGYLQLDPLGRSRFGRIVNHEMLYSLILKSVWGFVDWILERGFEYEQAKLEEYLQLYPVSNQAGLSPSGMQRMEQLVLALRDETHPQQYLKKVALLYREASKVSKNADGLLLVYQETLLRVGQGGGSRRLHLFRMRNVVDKLMRLDESSLNGGEINYSWTTWCVMVELFRERIVTHYGKECAEEGPHSLLARMDSLIAEVPLQIHKCHSL